MALAVLPNASAYMYNICTFAYALSSHIFSVVIHRETHRERREKKSMNEIVCEIKTTPSGLKERELKWKEMNNSKLSICTQILISNTPCGVCM